MRVKFSMKPQEWSFKSMQKFTNKLTDERWTARGQATFNSKPIKARCICIILGRGYRYKSLAIWELFAITITVSPPSCGRSFSSLQGTQTFRRSDKLSWCFQFILVHIIAMWRGWSSNFRSSTLSFPSPPGFGVSSLHALALLVLYYRLFSESSRRPEPKRRRRALSRDLLHP